MGTPVSVTLDEELLNSMRGLVETGKADSLSSLVAAAVAQFLDTDRRLDGLRQLLADYEAENGPITEEMVKQQELADLLSAAAIRRKARRDSLKRQQAARAAIEAYEAESGEITETDMEAAEAEAQTRAAAIRARRSNVS